MKKKKQQCCFFTGTQTELYKHRRWLEAGNFGFIKKNCTICVAKTKALCSYCEADLRLCFRICSFSYEVAHISMH